MFALWKQNIIMCTPETGWESTWKHHVASTNKPWPTVHELLCVFSVPCLFFFHMYISTLLSVSHVINLFPCNIKRTCFNPVSLFKLADCGLFWIVWKLYYTTLAIPKFNNTSLISHTKTLSQLISIVVTILPGSLFQL